MNWITNAPNYGFPTGKVPVVGAVVVYQPGVQWAGSVGHTAYVESVSSSNPNYFTITEMSWGGDCSVNTRNSWVQDGVDFIYNKNSLIRPSYVEASDGVYLDKISVLWNPSPGATHYQAWRGLTNSSATAGLLESNIGTNSFDDITITPGVLYYYWIKACNASFCTSFSSYNSGYASITLPPNPPPAPNASDNLFQDKVAVSWTSVVNATRYEVWRGTEIDPATSSLLNSDTNTPFHDNSALPGALYYYRVKACNEQGCSGFQSL